MLRNLFICKERKYSNNWRERLFKPRDENPWHIKCVNYNCELHITKVRNILENNFVFTNFFSGIIFIINLNKVVVVNFAVLQHFLVGKFELAII